MYCTYENPGRLEAELEGFMEIIQRAAWDSTANSFKQGNKEIIYPVKFRELIKYKDWLTEQ